MPQKPKDLLMTKEEEARLGRVTEEMLEILEHSFDEIDHDIFTTWKETGLCQLLERKKLHQQAKAVNLLKQKLQKRIASGKMAAKELERQHS